MLQAYGFKSDDDLLKKLFILNLQLAEKEKRGEAIALIIGHQKSHERRSLH